MVKWRLFCNYRGFMRIRHGAAIVFSGVIWMGVGMLLLLKGFRLLLKPSLESLPILLPRLGSLTTDREQASLVLISLGLLLGFIKGRFVLAKVARRIIERIVQLANPASFFSIYDKKYWILLSSMILLGVSLKFLPIAYDLKALVDVAVGSALTNGSAFYFRHFVRPKERV